MELPCNDAMANAMVAGLGIASFGLQRVRFLENREKIMRILPTLSSEKLGMYFSYNNLVTHKHKYEILYDFFMSKIATDKQFYQGIY